MAGINRRQFFGGSVTWLMAAGTKAGLSRAQGERFELAPEWMYPKTEKAIGKGLDYLAEHQRPEGCFRGDMYRRNVAVVSLAGLAFMAHGSTPGRGRYGEEISRAVGYILAHTQESGYVYASEGASHGPMYGHGFACLFLAEVYGMWPDSEVRDKLAKAVRLIVDTQNHEGGWRYQPDRNEADVSVTICQVMALRAARNAGLYVPNDTIDRCTEYVKQCQNADGGFAYMLPGGESAFARSAAGIVALYSAGVYEGEEIRRGLEYLSEHQGAADMVGMQENFFYGHYYAVQAMWHAGGDYWRQWYPEIRDTLLARQKQNGSWFDQICPEYGTAMACLVLQMPNNYLPIFQR
ncbi:MAG: prenyltransferase/squalene oxidase repeat-containing protein [Planctomycetota bacterium]